MDSKYLKVKDAYIYGFIALFSLLLVLVIIPTQIQDGEPRLFPYIYGISLLLVSIFKLISILLQKEKEYFSFNKKVMKYVGINLVIYTVYIFLIEHVGYFAMSVLFIIVLMRVLGEGWKITILLSIVLPASIYLLFTEILALYFPSGFLF